MRIKCVETQEWIEEEFSKPIQDFEERTGEKCKKKSKWNPLKWICKAFTYVVKITRWVTEKIGKWVVRTTCQIVDKFVKLFTGIFWGTVDVFAGIFTWDGSRIWDGLIRIIIGSVEFPFTILRIFTLGDTLDYILEERNQGKLRKYVDGLVAGKYSGTELNDIREFLRTKRGAFGYRMKMRAVLTFLDSESPSPLSRNIPNLIILHNAGTIDLYELCGFKSAGGYWNRKRVKTLKKGGIATGGGGGEAKNPISEAELDLYISSNGNDGPKFRVFCMENEVLDTKLKAAELSARDLGIIPRWTTEFVEVTLPEDIIHEDSEVNDQAGIALASFLVRKIGREPKSTDVDDPNKVDDNLPAALQDLCTPVAVGVFDYKLAASNGYSTCLMKSFSGQGPDNSSGVTFIDKMPNIVWKYVPIHELGHYFGLSHVNGTDRIMFRPGNFIDVWTLPKLIWTKGEPSFTLNEAKQAWGYIVTNFPANCLRGQ